MPNVETNRPTTRARITVAVAVAVCVFVVVRIKYGLHPANLGYDFTFQWRAARALLAGENPYVVMVVQGAFPYNWPYFYPLPSAFFAVPFAKLDVQLAAACYLGVSSGLLAYGLSSANWWRLAVLLSAPFMTAILSGQASPLLTASYLIPWLGIVAWHKPNLGLAVFAAHPRRGVVLWGIVLAGIAFLFAPKWPMQWLQVANAAPEYHVAPLFVPGGPILLAGLVRWRRPEARLLVTLACVPHSMTFYDPLPLLLVPRAFRSLLLLGLASHAALWASTWWYVTHHLEGGARFLATAPFALWGIYVPALVMVLLRPNCGPLPVWMEQRLARAPAWLRGSPAAASPLD